MHAPSRTAIEDDPQFEGIVFDEDEEEQWERKQNRRVGVTYLWRTCFAAFTVWKIARRFPDFNGNPDPNVLIACLRERGIEIERNLERIAILHVAFVQVKQK